MEWQCRSRCWRQTMAKTGKLSDSDSRKVAANRLETAHGRLISDGGILAAWTYTSVLKVAGDERRRVELSVITPCHTETNSGCSIHSSSDWDLPLLMKRVNGYDDDLQLASC